MSDFGLILRTILKRKNFSQRAAAAALGMDQSTVSYYTRVKNPPRPHVVAHMAGALGVSAGELLGQGGGAREKLTAPPDPWTGWARQLRAAYRRDPAKITLAVQTAWPREAAAILTWLNER